MGARAGLKNVSTTVLTGLREAIASGLLRPPLDRAALVGFGVKHQLDAIEGALGEGHVERESPPPQPELVWTGPEAPAGAARDTAVVLRELFEGARESVILAGYSFDHAEDVLAPLYAVMRDRGVAATFFVDIPQIERHVGADAHVAASFKKFLLESWPFGEPRPRLYYDKRSLRPGPPWCSIHAKCVVVDGVKAFVSSANFTQRGQERNIEVGVLIEDAGFASYLAGQWLGLVQARLVGEHAAQ